MKGKGVVQLSKRITKELRPYCKRIRVAGSIRRGDKTPGDIDIVLIPKSIENLERFMKTLGRKLQGGRHESTWSVKGIRVELYYTNEKEWGAELLAYSSKKGSGIGLRMVAKRLGLKLTQHGLFNKKGKRLAGKTEKSIYSALGKRYKSPKNR